MKKIIFIVISFLLLCACAKDKQKADTKGTEKNVQQIEKKKAFPELQAGEFFLKGKNPFGETIALEGKNITGDTAVFRLSETELLVKDGYVIMKNLSYPPFRVFQTKDLMQVAELGVRGNGPDEFNFPTLVPTTDQNLFCYIFENTTNKMYSLDKKWNISYVKEPFQAKTYSGGFNFSETQMVNLGKTDFIYVDNSKTGKSIYRIQKINDLIQSKEVFNLALNPKRKSPFNYIGAFAVNQKKNRMVYGYKYFKILKFMDLDGKSVRTINFERDTFDEGSVYKINGLDQNVTHYWKIAAGEQYVYLLYSGRTPFEVLKEKNRGNSYIYVEQYDWNGNPIKKYKLDQWGYFTVDEQSKKIYLSSTDFDDPFFVYQLP